jgi:hypothetical protein
MRISEVEIISMFTPAVDSASKRIAETPECVRMPAPTTESLPIWSSCRGSRSRPGLLGGERLERGRGIGLGQREGDVGATGGGGRHVLHDHVDVGAGLGDDLEDLGGLARHVGHAATVTLAWPRSVATPATMGSSMDSSDSRGFFMPSPRTNVPSSELKVERALIITPCRRAYSTARMYSTLAPLAASSSISSLETCESLCAFGTTRGSAVKMPSTSL